MGPLQSAATAAIICLLAWSCSVRNIQQVCTSVPRHLWLTAGAGNESRVERLQEREELADKHLRRGEIKGTVKLASRLRDLNGQP
jgi:hypothetical protein